MATQLAPDRRGPRRGPGAHRGRRRPQRRRSPAAAAGSARWTTTARTRAARWARARSRTGWLRCPWHGYDYDPTTGKPPDGFTDAPVALPGRGARRRRLRRAARRRRSAARTVVRRAGRDAGRLGRRHRVRHGRPLQPRLRRRAAPGRGARRAALHRHPPRGRRRVRGLAPTASSPAGPRRASRSPARARRTCSPASTTPSSTARRCSRSPARCRRRCSAAARSRTSTCRAVFRDVARLHGDRARRLRPRRAGRRSRSSTRSTAAASPTSCCPTRCRTSRPTPPAGVAATAGAADRPHRARPPTLDAAAARLRDRRAGR